METGSHIYLIHNPPSEYHHNSIDLSLDFILVIPYKRYIRQKAEPLLGEDLEGTLLTKGIPDEG